MNFALMQPYFFPYLGYFAMMSSVDHFMFFDDTQFVKKSWMTRNRLLNISNGQPFYIRPELQNVVYRSFLNQVELSSQPKWKTTLLSQLNGYKTKAKFFKETKEFIEDILSEEYLGLADLNMKTTSAIAKYLGIEIKVDKYTDYNYWFDETPGLGDWGREVAIKVDATHYVNAPGGESFIFPDQFEKNQIKLGFIQPQLTSYKQGPFDFVSGLSIIDVLMFNGREVTMQMVKNYTINWKN